MRARFFPVLTLIAALVAALSLVACADPGVGPTTATNHISGEHAPAAVLHVADVEQLYAAVNDAANEGAAIVLAPGTYVLSATDAAGVARPNGGRLELQRDMSLYGVTDDRSAVVIDASGLPVSSVRFAFGSTVFPTAPVRMGRGSNTTEWLTVLGSPQAVASIATELTGTPSTRIRIAHVAATGAARGVDVRNVGTAMAGRAVQAEIVDGDFSRGIVGIRVANAAADHGDIDVVTSGNRSYMNIQGCAVENNLASFATITVRSNGDRFEDNGIGCQIGGGFVGLSGGAANFNTTVFEAHGSEFSNNTRTEFFNIAGAPTFTEFGGLLVAGGHSIAIPNTTSNNTVTVRLWGCKVSGNQDVDFQAVGGLSGAVHSGIAGTNNHVTIELEGVSKHIDVLATASLPLDPTGTNTVTVIR